MVASGRTSSCGSKKVICSSPGLPGPTASQLPAQRQAGPDQYNLLGIPSGTRPTTVDRCSRSHAQGHTRQNQSNPQPNPRGFPCRAGATTDSSTSCATDPLG